jgi:hypothetical protein
MQLPQYHGAVAYIHDRSKACAETAYGPLLRTLMMLASVVCALKHDQ